MKKDINIQIGERVRISRKNNMLSREELAELLDVSTLFLSYIECGQKGMSIQTLCNLCQVLHVSSDFILFGKSERSSEKSDAQLILDNLDPKYHPLAKEYLQMLMRSISLFQKLSEDN